MLRKGNPYLPNHPLRITEIIRLKRAASNSNTRKTNPGSKKVPIPIPVSNALKLYIPCLRGILSKPIELAIVTVAITAIKPLNPAKKLKNVTIIRTMARILLLKKNSTE
jgi:hypothetical protein